MNTAVIESTTETEALLKEIDRLTIRLSDLKKDFKENVASKITSEILDKLPDSERQIIKSIICNVRNVNELDNLLSDRTTATQHAIHMLDVTPCFGDFDKTKERLKTCSSFQLLLIDDDKKKIENWPEK